MSCVEPMQKPMPTVEDASPEQLRFMKEYASPEQLRSLQYQMEGDDCHPDVLIDGCATGVFSTGVVLYEMMAGHLPFNCTLSRHLRDGLAPASVQDRDCDYIWEQNAAMLSAQDEWVCF